MPDCTILRLPAHPADLRIAAEVRHLARDNGLSDSEARKAVLRFCRTVNTGHSTALAVMDARKVIRSYYSMIGQAPTGGAA